MAASRSMVLSLWLGGVLGVGGVWWAMLCQHGMSQAVAQADGSWRERFLREAPAAWKEYAEFARRLQGSCTTRYLIHSTGKKMLHRTEIKQNNECGMRTYEVLEGDVVRLAVELKAYNSRYSFMLGRRTLDGEWLVVRYGVEADQAALRQETRETIDAAFSAPVRAVRTRLVDLVGQSTFRVVEVKGVEHEGRECVAVRFENPHPMSRRPFVPEQGGVLVLDPSRKWCLCRAEIRSQYLGDKGPKDVSEVVVVEARVGKSGYPIPVRWTLQNDAGVVTSEYDLRDEGGGPLEREFTLSAFGLPEPVGVEWERPVRWYLWLMLAGVVCLVAGGVFYWLSRRRASGES
ncbi:MAG: hypothetical protein KatS3mg107_0903 [Gemmataceae bacterium]|nr:MAG: hypothetical protein KatS3mg107_0903 [Gemmataceae bacterium]